MTTRALCSLLAVAAPLALAVATPALGDVASGCGISRGEAELIVALYRKLRI
jgi:hypothetical protein